MAFVVKGVAIKNGHWARVMFTKLRGLPYKVQRSALHLDAQLNTFTISNMSVIILVLMEDAHYVEPISATR
jgi:hypothetical protein